MATVTKLDNLRIEAEKALAAEMRTMLCEATIGKSFQRFAFSCPNLAEYVISDAIAKYQANMRFWSTMGAFAHNYTDLVFSMASPHVPDFVEFTDSVAWSGHLDTIWEVWGEFCRKFAIGA